MYKPIPVLIPIPIHVLAIPVRGAQAYLFQSEG